MKDPAPETSFFIPLWLVWALAIGFVVAGLDSFAILNDNEGLYAEIPCEMLAASDWRLWVIPHLNGLPYMEKPPLLYWLTALSFASFGESEWSARVVPALSSLACVFMLLRFGEAVKRPQAGRLAAIMFVTGTGLTVMSHVLMFDMLLTALLTAAIMFAYRYMTEGGVRFVRIAYAFLALAILAKGFVALILFGMVVLGTMMFGARRAGEFERAAGKWFDPWALAIFFAIAVPWHLAAMLTEPIFGWFYFVNEHVLRFLGKREPHDFYSGPWWYYLPRMLIYLFPWSFMLPCMLVQSGSGNRTDPVVLQRFLWSAWLAPLIFFSLSSAKANYYLVVAMPFAAFQLALALEKRDFLRPAVCALPGVLMAALAAALCAAVLPRIDEAQMTFSIAGMEQHRYVFAAAGGAALLALGAAVCARRFAKIGLLAYLALPIWISLVMVKVLNAIEPTVSTRPLADYLKREQPGRAVYLYRNFEEQSSLPFYLKVPIPVIDTRSNDLLWGCRLRHDHICISGEQFASLLSAQPVAVVVTDRQLENFKAADFFARFKGEKHIGVSTVFFN